LEKKIDVERHVCNEERRQNLLHRRPAHHLRAALRVVNIHPEGKLHDPMEHAARKTPLPRLYLVQNRARYPSRTNHAIRLFPMADQFRKRRGRRRPVCVHVTNQIRQRSQFQPLDQRAAFPNRRRKLQRGNFRKFLLDFFHHAARVVAAPIQHHHQLEFSRIMPPKIRRILAQNRLNPILLVVGRDQQQYAGGFWGHAGAWLPQTRGARQI